MIPPQGPAKHLQFKFTYRMIYMCKLLHSMILGPLLPGHCHSTHLSAKTFQIQVHDTGTIRLGSLSLWGQVGAVDLMLPVLKPMVTPP